VGIVTGVVSFFVVVATETGCGVGVYTGNAVEVVFCTTSVGFGGAID
jgi:hypothetical protein